MKQRFPEKLSLMRELYRAYKGEMAAVAAYTYGQILFENSFSTLSDLLASVSLAEMRHYHTLGEALRDLGVSHALRTNLQDFSYRYEGNNTDRALPAARHYLEERIKEEKRSAEQYAMLAEMAATPAVKEQLRRLSQEESEHAAALEAALLRFSAS